MIHHLLERRISEKAHSSKWEAVIKQTALLLSIMFALMIGLGLTAYFGLIQSVSQFLLMAVCSVAGVGVAWLICLVMVVERRLDRKSLAASVEHDNDMLLDRLNTIVELDQRNPNDQSAAMYRNAIEDQAADLVPKLAPANPLKKRSVTAHLLVMLLLGVLTINFYLSASPLDTLAANATPQDDMEAPVPSLVIPDATVPTPDQPSETSNRNWGEIRISEPGRDLRITIHEDVPMLIEAASDRPLDSITWQTRVNDAEEITRPLPELTDPRYAVFQPTLKPVQLELAEWDVARYHAVANGTDKTQYASSTYFVEIIPGSDALAELPTAGYEHLEDLTDLIHRQQQVIRNTEKLTNLENTDEQKKMDSLAGQESVLASEGRAVHKEIAKRLDQKTLRKFASSIEAAGTEFAKAETALLEHTASESEPTEDAALMHLVDARRELANLIHQHPESFKASALNELQDRPTLTATQADPELAKLLKELAQEKHQTDQASQEIADLLDQQKTLQDEVQRRNDPQLPNTGNPETAQPTARELANKQSQIGDQFDAIVDQFPDAFGDLQGLSNQTAASLSRSTEQLSQKSKTDLDAVKHAKNRLRDLSDKLQQRSADYEMLQSESLQERIAANRKSYRDIEEATEKVGESQVAKITSETAQLLNEIPDNIGQNDTAAAKRSSPDNQQQGQATPPTSQREQAAQDHQLESVAETKEKITKQTENLQNTTDASNQSEIAKDLDQSLNKLADELKQETSKKQQSLDQKQMASQLNRFQEQTEAMQDAREFVQEALKREETIQSKAEDNVDSKTQYQTLARDQIRLEEDMTLAREQNPDGFQSVTSQCEKIKKEMQQTMRSLNAGQEDAPLASKQTVESLEQLEKSLAKQQQEMDSEKQQQIAQQMQKLINKLGEIEKKPDDFSKKEKQQTAGQCQTVGSMACKNPGGSGAGGQASASGKPTMSPPNSPTGPPEAPPNPASPNSGQPSQAAPSATAGSPAPTGSPSLGGGASPTPNSGSSASPEQALQEATERLAKSDGTQETSEAAGGLKQQMQSLANGLGPQPGRGMKPGSQAGKMSGQGDSLRAGGRESVERGLAQLESAARQGQQGTLSPQAGRALRNSGMSDILEGIQGQYGYNDVSVALIQKVKEELEGPKVNIDLKTVNRLRDQIQRAQRDLVIKAEASEQAEPILRNDPTKYPSAYRESIQKYFQTLSEDKPQ